MDQDKPVLRAAAATKDASEAPKQQTLATFPMLQDEDIALLFAEARRISSAKHRKQVAFPTLQDDDLALLFAEARSLSNPKQQTEATFSMLDDEDLALLFSEAQGISAGKCPIKAWPYPSQNKPVKAVQKDDSDLPLGFDLGEVFEKTTKSDSSQVASTQQGGNCLVDPVLQKSLTCANFTPTQCPAVVAFERKESVAALKQTQESPTSVIQELQTMPQESTLHNQATNIPTLPAQVDLPWEQRQRQYPISVLLPSIRTRTSRKAVDFSEEVEWWL